MLQVARAARAEVLLLVQHESQRTDEDEIVGKQGAESGNVSGVTLPSGTLPANGFDGLRVGAGLAGADSLVWGVTGPGYDSLACARAVLGMKSKTAIVTSVRV